MPCGAFNVNLAVALKIKRSLRPEFDRAMLFQEKCQREVLACSELREELSALAINFRAEGLRPVVRLRGQWQR
jgi:hypothetical protein